jgi:hypothetical protein
MQAFIAGSGTGPAMAFELEGKMVVSLLRSQYYWDRRKTLQSASSRVKMSHFHVVPLSLTINGSHCVPARINCEQTVCFTF